MKHFEGGGGGHVHMMKNSCQNLYREAMTASEK